MRSIALLTDISDGHPHREPACQTLDIGIPASAHCRERVTGDETAARELKLSTIDDLQPIETPVQFEISLAEGAPVIIVGPIRHIRPLEPCWLGFDADRVSAAGLNWRGEVSE